MANRLHWSRGKLGKGCVINGAVHTWPTDFNGVPEHPPGATLTFHIDPNGGVTGEGADAALAADERLHDARDEQPPDWSFDTSHTAALDTWEPELDDYMANDEIRPWARGQNGKGLIDRSGNMVTWATNEYGEPHHDDVASRLSMPYTSKVDIYPNGRASIPSPDGHSLFGMDRQTAEAQLAQLAPEHGLTFVPGFTAHVASELEEWLRSFDTPSSTAHHPDTADIHVEPSPSPAEGHALTPPGHEPKRAAADPYWLDHYIQRNGPYLYHYTRSPELAQQIVQNGMLPWDHPDNPSGVSHGGGSLTPRPNHVYLRPKMPRMPSKWGPLGVRVDLRKLNPENLNPDEDNMVGPRNMNRYDFTNLGEFPGINGGLWAEQNNMTQPSQTAQSLEGIDGVPTIAHYGPIPPEALSLSPDHNLYTASEELPEDELHIALQIPDDAKDKIKEWVDKQDWPEGTELEDPSEYHITLLYSKAGHEEHQDADWIRHSDGYKVRVTGVDEFGEDDKKAIVLRIDSHEGLQEHANDLIDMAENHGLEITRFPGGYKPHLTVAYAPHKPHYCRTPKLRFKTEPSKVSIPRAQRSGEDSKEASVKLSQDGVLNPVVKRGEAPDDGSRLTHGTSGLVAQRQPIDQRSTVAGVDHPVSLATSSLESSPGSIVVPVRVHGAQHTSDRAGDPLIQAPGGETPSWGYLTHGELIDCPRCHSQHPPGPCADTNIDQFKQMERAWNNGNPNGDNQPTGDPRRAKRAGMDDESSGLYPPVPQSPEVQTQWHTDVQDQLCPQCGSDVDWQLNFPSGKARHAQCPTCGWSELKAYPGHPQGDPFERAYQDAPVEHPLGPHTGSQRTAMPADPDWWQNYTQNRNMPSSMLPSEMPASGLAPLYHATDAYALPQIMEKGLLPWDHEDNTTGTRYGEGDYEADPEANWFEPRPGHVYMTDKFGDAERIALEAAQHQRNRRAILHIDPSYLDPQHINPDEDSSPWADMGFDGYHAEQPMSDDEFYDPSEYSTLGQIAEDQMWGLDPENTHQGITQHGRMAYNGVIPPEAITPHIWDERNMTWEPWDQTQAPWLHNEDDAHVFSKTANEEYYYHAAPTTERERIRQHGLIPAKPGLNERWWVNKGNPSPGVAQQPEGIYAVPSRSDIPAYVGEGADIWRIPRSQVTQMIDADPLHARPSVVIQHPVQAELHEPWENSELYQQTKGNQDMLTRTEFPEGADWQFMNGFWGEGVPTEEERKRMGIGYPDRVIGKTASPEMKDAMPICPRCQGTGKGPNIYGLLDAPTFNMSTGEEQRGAWLDGGSSTCEYCHGVGRLIPGDSPTLDTMSNEDYDAWGGFAHDWTHDPSELPALGTPKQGGMTLPQEQRSWQRLNERYPGQSTTLHSFPNGYTVQQHHDHNALSNVGLFMHNCWQGAAPDDQPLDWLALHDEHGMPRAAWYHAPSYELGNGQVRPGRNEEIYGMRNMRPSDDHLNMIAQFAQANNSTVNGQDPQRWIQQPYPGGFPWATASSNLTPNSSAYSYTQPSNLTQPDILAAVRVAMISSGAPQDDDAAAQQDGAEDWQDVDQVGPSLSAARSSHRSASQLGVVPSSLASSTWMLGDEDGWTSEVSAAVSETGPVWVSDVVEESHRESLERLAQSRHRHPKLTQEEAMRSSAQAGRLEAHEHRSSGFMWADANHNVHGVTTLPTGDLWQLLEDGEQVDGLGQQASVSHGRSKRDAHVDAAQGRPSVSRSKSQVTSESEAKAAHSVNAMPSPEDMWVDESMNHSQSLASRSSASTYYHGTNVQLNPGDLIMPGQGPMTFDPPHVEYQPNSVYITHSPSSAEGYASTRSLKHGGEPYVYEVQPLGELGPDPESVGMSPQWQTGYVVPQARVVRRVSHRSSASQYPAKLYHISPATNRESIQQHGLLPVHPDGSSMAQEMGNEPGVYGYEDPSHFGPNGSWPSNEWQDMWEIDPSGLHLNADEAAGMQGSWYSYDPIPSSAIRLHTPARRTGRSSAHEDMKPYPSTLGHEITTRFTSNVCLACLADPEHVKSHEDYGQTWLPASTPSVNSPLQVAQPSPERPSPRARISADRSAPTSTPSTTYRKHTPALCQECSAPLTVSQRRRSSVCERCETAQRTVSVSAAGVRGKVGGSERGSLMLAGVPVGGTPRGPAQSSAPLWQESRHMAAGVPGTPGGEGSLESPDVSYRMQHTAPAPGDVDVPMHALDQLVPDVYQNPHYYMHQPEHDASSWKQISAVRGNPEGMVTIYRATPGNSINPGDWVTPSESYAIQHSMHYDDPSKDMPILSMQVPAKHLWWDANDMNEFGYHGPTLGGPRTAAWPGPQDPAWKFQQGLCGTYAYALTQARPDLRFGVLDSPEVGFHAFAHDDTHAYDSLGKHPLPYTGIHNDWLPEEMILDMDPKFYGMPDDEAGPEGPQVNIAQALAHARSIGLV